MVLYKDLHKQANDLVNDFCYDKPLQVENNWKSNGVSFKNKTCMSGSINAGFNKWALNTDIVHSCKGFTGTVKFNPSNPQIVAEFKSQNAVTPGLTATQNLELGTNSINGYALVEYENKELNDVHADLKVVPRGEKSNFTASAAINVGVMNGRLGADLTGPLDFASVKYSGGVKLAPWASWTLGMQVMGESSSPAKAKFTEWIHCNEAGMKGAEAGVQVAYSLGDALPKCVLGGKYKCCESSSIKACVSDDMKVRAALGFNRSGCGNWTFAVQMDPQGKNIDDQIKFGAKVAFA